jgi:hypothetical protein
VEDGEGDTVGETRRGRHSGRDGQGDRVEDGEGDTVGETRRGRHSGRDTVRETQWERHGEGDTVGETR